MQGKRVRETVDHCCAIMTIAIDDRIVFYRARFRKYGLRVPGCGSFQLITHCPFCGSRLPLGLQERWLQETGLDSTMVPSRVIPKDFRSDKWWKELGIPPDEGDPNPYDSMADPPEWPHDERVPLDS